MTSRRQSSRLWLALGGALLVLLAGAIFTLGSLNFPIQPTKGNAVLVLFAVSTFILAAFLVFGLILVRTLVRLWAERRGGQLGARFKTKMVLGAMGISLIPVIFLFFISYALVNRTLNLWFPRPLEIASEQSQELLDEYVQAEHNTLNKIAGESLPTSMPLDQIHLGLRGDIDAAWELDSNGLPHDALDLRGGMDFSQSVLRLKRNSISPRLVRTLPGDVGVWEANGNDYITGQAEMRGGVLVLARLLPHDFLKRYNEIEAQTKIYAQQRQQIRIYKREILGFLALVTLLILFAATWTALYLSKQVTVPIQALAEATQKVARGNLAHRVEVRAQDELGTLVNSFNQMTMQLGESRQQIDDFTRSLQLAIQENERRRKLMETILENIPTGVLSLDSSGAITRMNSAVPQIFGDQARNAHTMADLLGEDAARDVLQLMRKSLRMGAASRELEFAAAGRLLHAAVTVSSLGPRRSNPGFVVVIDDLTELLRAQKAAAWQQVAQRIAHEIKNPLTPIQLSAQRLLRHLERAPAVAGSGLETLVAECAALIEREVQTLETLVNEFSEFARFPAAKLAPADLNGIVCGALDVFHGRLDGITVRAELAPALPVVKADAELLRRVLVNLIDNAAEAMEGATTRTLAVATRLDSDGEAVEIEVADSGHGISPEDKDKLFLPHFSTKERGTGLGLAIASRIVSEHHGTLRVEDNVPSGARFIVRFPVAEVIPAQSNSHTG